ncbi:MAG TPA: contractile injection system tape measure protein, partial [Flavisolibacter sp.]|nr:contractile injection system tape measure protein [Flavisolibacter sp.]
ENDPRKPAYFSPAEKQKLVLTYLQSGQLPWYAAVDVSELMEWLQQMVVSGFFSSSDGKAYLKENRSAFQRFLRQLKPDWLETWANQWLSGEQKRLLPGILTVARRRLGPSPAALEWTYALLFDGLALTGQTLQEIRSPNDKFVEQLELLIEQSMDPALQQLPAKNESGIQAFFIQNAGLVLLHPFLKLFFERLAYLNETGGWKSETLQRRSVLLLHYLCSAKSEAAEYELPLCKLLVGYPFAQPVEAKLDLTGKEVSEAEALLQNVIDQWPILKSTSAEGLRNSFLRREGKLSRQDNGWLLQVEQRSFDILLQHLPWGIGVIKNSWMEEMLFTEWT